ncbi:MAG: hypothetical protein C4293_16250 [Nitrospiraceae bacterium]
MPYDDLLIAAAREALECLAEHLERCNTLSHYTQTVHRHLKLAIKQAEEERVKLSVPGQAFPPS